MEQGDAWALAWRWRWRESAELVAEWLAIASEREAWEYLDEAPEHRTEQSLGLALRWRF